MTGCKSARSNHLEAASANNTLAMHAQLEQSSPRFGANLNNRHNEALGPRQLEKFQPQDREALEFNIEDELICSAADSQASNEQQQQQQPQPQTATNCRLTKSPIIAPNIDHCYADSTSADRGLRAASANQPAALAWRPQSEPGRANERVAFGHEQELRRTRRLMAIFRVWRSKSEMEQVVSGSGESGAPLASSVNLEMAQQAPRRATSCASATSNSRHNHHNHNHHRHLMYIPTSASSMPFIAVAGLSPANLAHVTHATSDGTRQRKLWQSLVMPLALGCILFLAAVWTRQVSLVLMSDTGIMVIILGVVFVVMSAFAFWLAQDQPHGGSENEQHTCRNLHSQHSAFSRNSRRAEQHYDDNHDDDSLDATQNEQHFDDPNKCCSVSFINCHQPPDYYSALRNSFPINYQQQPPDFLAVSGGSRLRVEGEKELDVGELQALALARSESLPPSYNELMLDDNNTIHLNNNQIK